jgi:ABC-2 type transport system permease protein
MRTESQTTVFVKTLCSLKIRILKNSLVRDKRARITLGLMFAGTLIGSMLFSYSFFKDAAAGPVAWRRSVIPGCVGIFVGWCFGPLLLGGVDDMVDPERLVAIPIPRRCLAAGLLAAASIGVFPFATLVALLGMVAAYGRSYVRIVPILLLVVTLFAMCVIGSRLLAVGLALLRRHRRGRDLSVLLAAFAAASLWMLTQTLQLFGPKRFDQIVRWMRWTPPGALGQAIVEVRSGQIGQALLRLFGVWLLLILGVVAWSRLLAIQLVSPPSNVAPMKRSKPSASLQTRTPGEAEFGGANPSLNTPKSLFATLVGREFRYLRRSPQRRAALLVGMAIGPLFALLQAAQAGRRFGMLFAPIAVLFGVGAANNVLGSDAPSLWIERSCSVPFITMIRARSLGALPFLLLPPLFSVALIEAFVGANSKLLLLVSVLIIVSWGVPIGVGAIISVTTPFPQLDSDNPFSNRRPTAGEGCLIGVLGIVGMIVSLLFVTPLIIVGVLLLNVSLGFLAPFAVGGFVYSFGFWRLTTWLAAARLRSRGDELLETLSRRNATA